MRQRPSFGLLAALLLGALEARAQAAAPFECSGDSTPSPPPVEPLDKVLSGEALQAYGRGMAAVKAKEYANAAKEFGRAYESSRQPRLLWNLAGAHEKSGDHVAALEWLLNYFESGVPFNPALVCAEFKAWKSQVTELTITVSEPGATVSIDDVPRGESPLPRPLFLDPGPHKIRVEKPGFHDHLQTVKFTVGEHPLPVRLLPELHEGQVDIATDADAQIRIDGEIKGMGRWQGVLKSGSHRVSVTAPGKVGAERTIVVEDGTRSPLVIVHLEPMTPPPVQDPVVPPEIKVPWLWIGVGTAAAALAGLGVYGLTRSDDHNGAPPVEGTFATLRLPLQ